MDDASGHVASLTNSNTLLSYKNYWNQSITFNSYPVFGHGQTTFQRESILWQGEILQSWAPGNRTCQPQDDMSLHIYILY